MVTTDDEHKRPYLRVIQGKGRREATVRSVKIVASSEDKQPFPVEALALEEDTFLVLSADPVVREPREHPLRVIYEARKAVPEEPGTVIVKETSPLKFLAIVHDLNQDPTWREEWVISCLIDVLRESEQRRLRSLALPLLGTKHGSLTEKRFLTILKAVLKSTPLRYLDRIWLIVPAKLTRTVIEIFDRGEQG